MPRLVSETFGSGDQSWLGSSHGIHNCRTVTIDRSSLTAATHYPDGYVRSGQPLAIVGGLAVPYNSAGADGSQVLAGFLLADASMAGTEDVPAALLWHGRIIVANLPVTFASAGVTTSGLFSFEG